MNDLFFTQFAALFWKNWIIISKHKLPILACCVILPIGNAVFLAGAQNFFQPRNKYGLGTPVPVYNLSTQFDGSLTLVWADGTNGMGSPSANDIMGRVTSGFNEHQLGAVTQVTNPKDIPSYCPENFMRLSACFAGISFNYLPVSSSDVTPFNYTIHADGGLGYTNVYTHMSDFETRILPLQLAIDEAFIALQTGESIPTPSEWLYAQETNQRQSTYERLSYIRGIRNLTVIAFFACYIGIAYHLPAVATGERANLLTSYMKAMGLLDSARILSWHASISLAHLPAWIAVALIWHHQVFTKTHVGLVLVVHLLLGLSLGSWSFFVAAPFGQSPQLAATVSMLLAILFAIVAIVFSHAGTAAATVFTLFFPPGYYVFAIRAICGYENHLQPANLLKPDPDNHLTLLPIMLACVINLFLWPYLGLLLEKHLYDARETLGISSCLSRGKREELPSHPEGVAISIKNLSKIFAPSMFSREKGPVTAIADLSLDIPKSGIFVLLGSNGAGKSTSLSIMANVIRQSSGSVTFEGGQSRPPRGALGIVPQKNVLFPNLTCYQTLQVWHAIKCSSRSAREDDDYAQLLRDCDLGKKIHANANTLSGGQKRKLQLAIGLVGGSKIILVDECTSGVDPLSRRALWRTLTSVKHDRTIVYTTHFLDEADLLADHIAILAAPGELVAEGSPVALKTNLGHGYSIQVTFSSVNTDEKNPACSSLEILDRVREFAPQCTLTHSSPTQVTYHLKSKDSVVVENVLRLLGDDTIACVDILGTSIEDIFLDLMEPEVRTPTSSEKSPQKSASTLNVVDSLQASSVPSPLTLTDGRPRSPFEQTLTIFYKRMLIARKSWLAPLLCILVGVCGACIPLVFIAQDSTSSIQSPNNTFHIPLYWPDSPMAVLYGTPNVSILESPPNITATLGPSAESILAEGVPDNATFVSMIQQDYLNIPVGGISVDMQTGDALIAWDTTPLPGHAGPVLLNLVTNILYNRALNASGNAADTPNIIMANYATLPANGGGSFDGMKFVLFFGAAMTIYPAFFALYVSRERQSSVQAMQFSNGLSNPIGLWVGHLLWDSIFAVIIATITIVIFATASNQLHGVGFLWVILVQYGIVGILFSYCVSLFMSCPVASFAAVAGIQVTMYSVYFAGYFLTATYAKTSKAPHILTLIHFTLAILSPIANVLRAVFVSINMFSLLRTGPTPITVSLMGDIMRYGGPILYLFVHGFVLFGVLVCADSKFIIPPGLLKTRKLRARPDEKAGGEVSGQDVAGEARAVAHSDDPLRVLHVSKSYDGNKVVDDVSFGVPEGVIFAMLGPNGAGKTTTFKMIRGDVAPDAGDVKIKGTSVVNNSRNARLALGVCPQFTAIDTELTVREHLSLYGRLKGLISGPELDTNVESIMVATSLHMYADRLASQLSCGNQRKLSLAIALLGNPSVLLVDEFSTGIDVGMKRHMWNTLRQVAVGKAVVITTHSMEEASALASKVGIISKKMLAIGTTEELVARHATYHVQFSCRTREDVMRAQVLMSQIPGARLAEDVATRFEVPIRQGGSLSGDDGNMSLAGLFHFLSTQGDFEEYTVEKATLENVFLNVIRENNILEHDGPLDFGRDV